FPCITVSSCPLSPCTFLVFFFITPRTPSSTLFPYTTLFRSPECPVARREFPERPVARFAFCARAGVGRPSPLQNELRPLLFPGRSEEHTSELQSHLNLVCRLLLEKTNINRMRA